MIRWACYLLLAAVGCFAVDMVRAADITVPSQVTAGQPVTLRSQGSGTMIIAGPGKMLKRDVKSGEEVTLKAEELRNAGLYTVSVAGKSASFFVVPGPAKKLSFLARPSRVPVAQPNAISGTAFVFDDYQNMVVAPTPVKFDLTVDNRTTFSRTVPSKDGIAYVLTASGRQEGAAQFIASVGETAVRRLVQQVASDPCTLHMTARHDENANAIVLETAPIRDCSGNAVPDGTIVTFTSIEKNGGRSQVDARIKKGIARAQLPLPATAALLRVASGIVIGNDIQWGRGNR